jgi:hypothetical protein
LAGGQTEPSPHLFASLLLCNEQLECVERSADVGQLHGELCTPLGQLLFQDGVLLVVLTQFLDRVVGAAVCTRRTGRLDYTLE